MGFCETGMLVSLLLATELVRGGQLTAQHQPLNGLNCTLLIALGIFF